MLRRDVTQDFYHWPNIAQSTDYFHVEYHYHCLPFQTYFFPRNCAKWEDLSWIETAVAYRKSTTEPLGESKCTECIKHVGSSFFVYGATKSLTDPTTQAFLPVFLEFTFGFTWILRAPVEFDRSQITMEKFMFEIAIPNIFLHKGTRIREARRCYNGKLNIRLNNTRESRILFAIPKPKTSTFFSTHCLSHTPTLSFHYYWFVRLTNLSSWGWNTTGISLSFLLIPIFYISSILHAPVVHIIYRCMETATDFHRIL